ncbi:Ig-like domain-containing protein, partial [Paenibacillus residui]
MKRKGNILAIAFLLIIQNFFFAISGLANPIVPLQGTGSTVTNAVYFSDVKITEDDEETVINAVYNPDSRIVPGSVVVLHYGWGLPDDHGLQGGEIYQFELPSDFELYNDIPDTPLSTDLGSVGTFSVDKSTNIVTMKFNQNVDRSNVGGKIMIWSAIREDLVGETINREIHFPLVGDGKIIPINLQPKGGSAIQKAGTPDKEYNGQELYWSWTVKSSTALRSERIGVNISRFL